MAKQKLYLWLIERQDEIGYDEYTGAVVAAINEDTARFIHPNGEGNTWNTMQSKWMPLPQANWPNDTWPVKPEEVKVTLIGVADKNIKPNSVVLDSFRAG